MGTNTAWRDETSSGLHVGLDRPVEQKVTFVGKDTATESEMPASFLVCYDTYVSSETM